MQVAGIAYVCHMGANREPFEALPGPAAEVPRWMQLASGVLFVCMLLAGAAAVAAVARTLTGLGYTPACARPTLRKYRSTARRRRPRVRASLTQIFRDRTGASDSEAQARLAGLHQPAGWWRTSGAAEPV